MRTKSDYMRSYMRSYRAKYPEREFATIMRAVDKRGGIMARHPRVCDVGSLFDLASSAMRPDEVLMFKEEFALILEVLGLEL